jgi:hypothetical protein
LNTSRRRLVWYTVAGAAWLMALLPMLSAGQGTEEKKGSEPPFLTAEQFGPLHRLIKPQPDELRFREIPWVLSVWEARKQAAAEGKPILVWSGSGGAPIAVC